MNFTNTNKIVLALVLLCSTAFVSHLAATKSYEDPIVGAWWYNQAVAGEFPSYGVAAFYEDGTWISHDSAALTQSVPSLAPLGIYTTVATGYWTKTDKGRYIIIASFVALQRGLDSSHLTPDGQCTESSPAAPACPTGRVLLSGSFIFDVRSNCQQASSPDFIGTFASLDTFEIQPDNTLPLPRVWHRLNS